MNKDESKAIIKAETIEGVIYIIRGQKVMLDRDLAMLYGIETRTLVQAVKRNLERFPDDFMFQLTKHELENWRSQIVISNYATKMSLRYPPYAFTEQGVAMLASVLRSPQAAKVNIEIVRTFIRLRHTLASHAKLSKEFAELKEFVLKNSLHNNREFKRIWNAIEKLTTPPKKEERPMRFDLRPKS